MCGCFARLAIFDIQIVFPGKTSTASQLAGKPGLFPNIFPQYGQIMADGFRGFANRFFIWTNFTSLRLHDSHFFSDRDCAEFDLA